MKKDNNGSFTVEAAFALPIFIFAVLAFVYLFRMVLMQVQLQGALSEAAVELSGSAYLTEELTHNEENSGDSENIIMQGGGKLATGATIRKYFVKESSYSNMLKNKISYVSSSYLQEDKIIDLISEYTIEIPLPLIEVCNIPIIQRIKTRAYVGTDKLLSGNGQINETSGNDEDYVYVTETGSVYHLSLECSSLKLTIYDCNRKKISKKRNVYGGCYKACEKCCKGEFDGDTVYICSDGDAYHYLLDCSGLKRTIKKVKLSEVSSSLRACMRCKR